MSARVASPLIGALVLVGAVVPVSTAPGAAALPAAVVTAAADDTVGESATGRVLVRFTAGATENQRGAARAAVGATDAGAVGATSWRALTVTRTDLPAVAAELRAAAGVAAVQLDHLREAAGWPSDPELAFNSFTYTRAQVASIRLPRAWDAATGEGVVVAVVDEGTNAADEDLGGAVQPGVDLVPTEPDPQLTQSIHGTAVSRIVAARANNGVGSAGVGPRIAGPPGARARPDGADPGLPARGGHRVGGHERCRRRQRVDRRPGHVAGAPGRDRGCDGRGCRRGRRGGQRGRPAPQYPAAYAPDVAGLLSVSANNGDGLLTESSWGDTVSLAAPGQHLGLTARRPRPPS